MSTFAQHQTTPSHLTSGEAIALGEEWSTHNYHPLPVVISRAEGAWVTDVEGHDYLDFLAGYSALNFGHRHPELVSAVTEQLGRVSLTSRAFHHDQFGVFCHELAELTGTETVLPMNSGAEAVESAIKVARKWAYQVKGIPADAGEIVVASSGFHGRTTTIVSFSTDDTARADFGPFTPGFVIVPFGDVDALAAAITDRTAAVLLEPIQGEAGVIVPPDGYFTEVRRLCDEAGALLIADEIQSGLGRTGTVLALDHERIRADLYTLGKALGGGILPLSAVIGRADVLGRLRPGEHGSTFGGNPLACAVGRTVIRLLATGELQHRSTSLGAHLHARLYELVGHGIDELRGRGLWAGLDLTSENRTGRQVCTELLKHGVLCKETHGRTLRIAPPLVIAEDDLDRGLDVITRVITRS